MVSVGLQNVSKLARLPRGSQVMTGWDKVTNSRVRRGSEAGHRREEEKDCYYSGGNTKECSFIPGHKPLVNCPEYNAVISHSAVCQQHLEENQIKLKVMTSMQNSMHSLTCSNTSALFTFHHTVITKQAVAPLLVQYS